MRLRALLPVIHHWVLPLGIIGVGILMRLIPHLPNFAPITAIAIFGGLYLGRKYALVLPLIIMLISDFFLGFHDTIFFVYVSFMISGLLGLWARKQKTAGRILLITVVSSVLFFLITNLGVWLVSGMYEKSPRGLLEAFLLALPFFRNTIFGDLLYTTTFVLLFELLEYLAQRRQLAVVKRGR